MKKNHIFLCCCAFIIIDALPLFPQTEDDREAEIPAAILERYFRTDAERNSTLYGDFLRTWDDAPIDLNTASQEELLCIPGMTPLLAKNIIERRIVQPFLESYDLSLVDGMTPDMLSLLTRCAVFRKSGTYRVTRGSFRETVFRNLQESAGFLNGKFLGDPYALRSRLTARIEPPSSWSSACSEITNRNDIGKRCRRTNCKRLFRRVLSCCITMHFFFDSSGRLYGRYRTGIGAVALSGICKSRRGDFVDSKEFQ